MAFGDKIKTKGPIVSVDNTADCHALIRGSHRDSQTAALASVIILKTRKMNIAPFFNYVASEMNTAGWPARRDLESRSRLICDARPRIPVTTPEWHDAGLFIKRLRAEGAGLSHLAVDSELIARELLADASGAASAGVAALTRSGALASASSSDDPTGRALSLQEWGT